MTTNMESLLEDNKRTLLKALRHLDYSYKKVLNLSTEISQLDDESLEAWEGFSARFSRASDIFLKRYVRTIVLKNDPGFEGTLRDFVNQGEKLGVVDDAEAWMQIRELRNITAHEYSEKELSDFFKKLKTHSPRILLLQKILK